MLTNGEGRCRSTQGREKSSFGGLAATGRCPGASCPSPRTHLMLSLSPAASAAWISLGATHLPFGFPKISTAASLPSTPTSLLSTPAVLHPQTQGVFPLQERGCTFTPAFEGRNTRIFCSPSPWLAQCQHRGTGWIFGVFLKKSLLDHRVFKNEHKSPQCFLGCLSKV